MEWQLMRLHHISLVLELVHQSSSLPSTIEISSLMMIILQRSRITSLVVYSPRNWIENFKQTQRAKFRVERNILIELLNNEMWSVMWLQLTFLTAFNWPGFHRKFPKISRSHSSTNKLWWWVSSSLSMLLE